MPSCNIIYDNNSNGIYYSGQTLSGVIQLNNDKKRSVRGVTLRIEGYALCKWTENEGSGKNRRTIYYSGREDYINSFSYLIGSFNTTKTDLSAGLHQFNFSCVLPPQLPTSLESKYGHVRYQVKVELERPWKTDYKYCFAFTVIRNFDLNYENPVLRNPLKVEKNKQFFFGLSSKGLYITAEIPLTGFVCGQQVPVSINVNNESNVEVSEIAVELVKIIQYNSDTPRKKTRERYEHTAITQCSGVAVKSKSSVSSMMLIPAVPPTTVGTCRILSHFYEVHVVAKTGAFHRDAVLRLPITIGTVPLFASPSIPHYQNQAMANLYPQINPENPLPVWSPPTTSTGVSSYQNQQPAPSAPTQLTPDQFDLPPPSYHEAMAVTSPDGDNDEGMNDQLQFNPRYPVFNFANYGIQPPHAQPTSQGANQAQIFNQPPPPAYSTNNPLAPPYGQPTLLVNAPQFPSNDMKKEKY